MQFADFDNKEKHRKSGAPIANGSGHHHNNGTKKKRRSSILKTNLTENIVGSQDTITVTTTSLGTKRQSRRVSFAETRVVQEFHKDGLDSRSPRQEPAYKDCSLSSNEASRAASEGESHMSLTRCLPNQTLDVQKCSQSTNLSVQSMQETRGASSLGAESDLMSISPVPMQETVLATPGQSDSIWENPEKTEAFMLNLIMSSTPARHDQNAQHNGPTMEERGVSIWGLEETKVEQSMKQDRVIENHQNWQDSRGVSRWGLEEEAMESGFFPTRPPNPEENGTEEAVNIRKVWQEQSSMHGADFRTMASDEMDITEDQSVSIAIRVPGSEDLQSRNGEASITINKTENLLEELRGEMRSAGSDEMSFTETEMQGQAQREFDQENENLPFEGYAEIGENQVVYEKILGSVDVSDAVTPKRTHIEHKESLHVEKLALLNLQNANNSSAAVHALVNDNIHDEDPRNKSTNVNEISHEVPLSQGNRSATHVGPVSMMMDSVHNEASEVGHVSANGGNRSVAMDLTKTEPKLSQQSNRSATHIGPVSMLLESANHHDDEDLHQNSNELQIQANSSVGRSSTAERSFRENRNVTCADPVPVRSHSEFPLGERRSDGVSPERNEFFAPGNGLDSTNGTVQSPEETRPEGNEIMEFSTVNMEQDSLDQSRWKMELEKSGDDDSSTEGTRSRGEEEDFEKSITHLERSIRNIDNASVSMMKFRRDQDDELSNINFPIADTEGQQQPQEIMTPSLQQEESRMLSSCRDQSEKMRQESFMNLTGTGIMEVSSRLLKDRTVNMEETREKPSALSNLDNLFGSVLMKGDVTRLPEESMQAEELVDVTRDEEKEKCEEREPDQPKGHSIELLHFSPNLLNLVSEPKMNSGDRKTEKLIASCIGDCRLRIDAECVEKLKEASSRLKQGISDQMKLVDPVEDGLRNAIEKDDFLKMSKEQWDLMLCCQKKAEVDWNHFREKVTRSLIGNIRADLAKLLKTETVLTEKKHFSKELPALRNKSAQVNKDLESLKKLSPIDVDSFLKSKKELEAEKIVTEELKARARMAEFSKQSASLKLSKARLMKSQRDLEAAQNRSVQLKKHMERVEKERIQSNKQNDFNFGFRVVEESKECLTIECWNYRLHFESKEDLLKAVTMSRQNRCPGSRNLQKDLLNAFLEGIEKMSLFGNMNNLIAEYPTTAKMPQLIRLLVSTLLKMKEIYDELLDIYLNQDGSYLRNNEFGIGFSSRKRKVRFIAKLQVCWTRYPEDIVLKDVENQIGEVQYGEVKKILDSVSSSVKRRKLHAFCENVKRFF